MLGEELSCQPGGFGQGWPQMTAQTRLWVGGPAYMWTERLQLVSQECDCWWTLQLQNQSESGKSRKMTVG